MRVFQTLVLAVTLILAACSHEQSYVPGEIEVIASTSVNSTPAIVSLDSLGQRTLNSILLKVEEVQIHKDSAGWKTIAEPHQVFDFLQLTDTITFVLADTLVEPGYYSQLRLIVAETNEVVIDGVSYPLVVPSGTQTGVKLNLDVAINGGETARIYLEFDEETAVIENANGFYLRPSFRLNIELQP